MASRSACSGRMVVALACFFLMSGVYLLTRQMSMCYTPWRTFDNSIVFGRVPKENAPLGKSTSVQLSRNSLCAQRKISQESAFIPHGLSAQRVREQHISLLYRGAHGNRCWATSTNAWGEMTSTVLFVRAGGQASSWNQEPPAFYAGECQMFNPAAVKTVRARAALVASSFMIVLVVIVGIPKSSMAGAR